MRFWFSFPFIGRTRLGVSVSDQELRRAFANRRRPSSGRAIVDLICLILLLIMFVWLVAFWVSLALAGTCRHYSDGANSVTECTDNGVVTGYPVRGPDGRTRVYGEPNAGFQRYDEPQPFNDR